MTWSYLVGGDADGQFFQWHQDEEVFLLRPRGVMLRGSGSWIYQVSNCWMLGSGYGRCQVNEARG